MIGHQIIPQIVLIKIVQRSSSRWYIPKQHKPESTGFSSSGGLSSSSSIRLFFGRSFDAPGHFSATNRRSSATTRSCSATTGSCSATTELRIKSKLSLISNYGQYRASSGFRHCQSPGGLKTTLALSEYYPPSFCSCLHWNFPFRPFRPI